MLNLTESNKQNIELAQQAAAGDRRARKKVNELIAPVIQYQTNRFCKRFCKENRYHYACTLNPPVCSPPPDCSLCEWGNGSYAWMLDDLSHSNRLLRYQAKNNATLFDYCYVIANSLPFYERWKDWRFGRKIYVPEYIRAMGKTAVIVFYGMLSQHNIEQISQNLSQPVEAVKKLSRQIVQVLIQKKKLHLLNPSQHVSLSPDFEQMNSQSELEAETATIDKPIEVIEREMRLSKAWKKLTPVEQFVIEALVIEDQDAQIVLDTLRKLDMSIKEGTVASETDRQQLYYFRRKTLAKLHTLLQG